MTTYRVVVAETYYKAYLVRAESEEDIPIVHRGDWEEFCDWWGDDSETIGVCVVSQDEPEKGKEG